MCFVYFCQRNTKFIIYNSIVSPTACAVASESPIPLVKLEMVVPEIVPEIISLFILTVTVPDVGKLVEMKELNLLMLWSMHL